MCEWKSKYLSYECKEPPLPDDPKGYCILHSAKGDKDPEAFKKEVEKRLKTGDEKIDLVGCYFPRGFEVKFVDERFEKPVDFSAATFTEGADFRGATFTEWANFSWATFAKGANFSGAKFTEGADFRGATFTKGADFSGAKFTQGADFIWATFTEGANFRRATFTEEANFCRATFKERAYFGWATFKKVANFSDATFTKEANFSAAKFTGWAYFSKATFTEMAQFDVATFTGEANFGWATFTKWASFIGATFTEVAQFGRATFTEEANFSGATFSEGAGFGGATFSEEAHFGGATFAKRAYFNEATFTKRPIFGGATFTEVEFTGTAFTTGACFDHAEFRGRVLFRSWSSMVGGKRPVLLGPGSSFQNTRFPKEAMFQDIDLSHCSFLHSNIDEVDFRYCEFAKEEKKSFFIFSPRKQNVLRDELDADKKVEESLNKSDMRFFASLRMTREEKKLRGENYEPVRRLYQELKCNFEDKKDWNTAGDFHYGEMECRRKGRLEGWLDFFLVTAYYGASGYGERPWRALCCTAGIILLCVPFYWLFDFETYHTTRINLSIASDVSQPSHGLGYWLWYSLKAAFWGRFGEQGVEPPHLLGKGILFFESILSPFFIALFILALRRKVKR